MRHGLQQRDTQRCLVWAEASEIGWEQTKSRARVATAALQFRTSADVQAEWDAEIQLFTLGFLRKALADDTPVPSSPVVLTSMVMPVT